MGLLVVLTNSIWTLADNAERTASDDPEPCLVQTRSQGRADNTEPELSEPYINYNTNEDDELELVFEIIYTDADGDEGEVLIYIDDEPLTMRTLYDDPTEDQYYYAHILEEEIIDDTEFYFYADDNNGSNVTLFDEDDDPFMVGEFLGWGDEPVLSNPDVYFDGDDYVFIVTYRDADGDFADEMSLNIVFVDSYEMSTTDTDPFEGLNYTVRVIESIINESSEFYFTVTDSGGSYAELYDDDWEYLVVEEFLTSVDPKDGGDGDGDGNDDGGDGESDGADDDSVDLGRWADPEVVVAIVALAAMGAGSMVGVWFRSKKRKRFSSLLTKIDEVYSSYKMHPRKCERELEKLKAEVDEDLKSNVIDENNYSILKERIGEVKQEIRSESMRSKVTELPKNMELIIKDMLIDGKISQAEYKKFMKVSKSSTMTSSDKVGMQKLVKEWMKEDTKARKK